MSGRSGRWNRDMPPRNKSLTPLLSKEFYISERSVDASRTRDLDSFILVYISKCCLPHIYSSLTMRDRPHPRATPYNRLYINTYGIYTLCYLYSYLVRTPIWLLLIALLFFVYFCSLFFFSLKKKHSAVSVRRNEIERKPAKRRYCPQLTLGGSVFFF